MTSKHPLLAERAGRHAWRVTLAALLLAACGGGVETGGTGGTAYVQGPVTGFGSVIVAGVRFDDAMARVEDADGSPRSRDELRLGMMVEVASGATSDDGNGGRQALASRVRLGSELIGPIGAIGDGATLLTVLGQPVRVNAATVVDVAGGAAALRAGDVVEVYGFFHPGEGYLATRLERRSTAPALYAVRGAVRDIDLAARHLRIGLQSFDFAATGLPAGIANGDFIRVKVRTSQLAGRWQVVSAALDAVNTGEHAEAEVEGLISAFTSARDFSVNGLRVDASGASFANGSAGLALGVRVKVRGRSGANGTLLAATVESRSDEDAFSEGFDLRDVIASVDAARQSFVLRGITVFYGSQPPPRFDNGSAADLAPGRRVRVRAVLAGDRQRVVATRIEFINN